MDFHNLSALVVEYRYWVLIPLTFLEGPIVAFVAGTLSSLGYFNIYALAVIFFVRDVSMDAVCYLIGYFGASRGYVKKLMEKAKIEEEHLGRVSDLWHRETGKTMFLSKLSYGIAAAFVVVAGVVKMPFSRFIYYGAVVTVLQYGSLLFVGYFFGNAFGGSLKGILENIQLAIGAFALFITIFYIFKWYVKVKLQKEEDTPPAN